MRKSLLKSVVVSFIFATVLLGGYSCSDNLPDDYLTENQVRKMIEDALRENNNQLEFTQWQIVPITVRKDQWEWKSPIDRYQAIIDLPELTEHIYENGAVLGYVFIGQQGVDEVQKTLPYVETYQFTNDKGERIGTYTETISYDVQYASNGNSTVAFFIQSSDLVQADEYLYDYNFRLVLVWK